MKFKFGQEVINLEDNFYNNVIGVITDYIDLGTEEDSQYEVTIILPSNPAITKQIFCWSRYLKAVKY